VIRALAHDVAGGRWLLTGGGEANPGELHPIALRADRMG
jgi:hypothetical protein